MTATAHLSVHPERCDRCGKCVRACTGGRLKVGGGYIYVDVHDCDGCFACVEVCERAAIVRAPKRPVAFAGVDSGRVVVGSRAEAKALRAAASRRAEQDPQRSGVAGRRLRDRVRALVPGVTGAAAQADGRVEWSLLDAAAVGLVLLTVIALKDALMDAPFVAVMPASGRVAVGTAALVLFYAAQVAVLAFLAWRRRVSFTRAFRLRTGFVWGAALSSAVLVTGLALVTRVVSLLWGALASGVGWNPPITEGSSLTAVFGQGAGGLLLALALAVVVGPITEELAFRGVIAPALDRRFGRRAAVLGSAGLFAFYHVTPWLFVPMFAFGCATAWLALTRRSLWPAIALHGLYNGVVVAAVFWLAR